MMAVPYVSVPVPRAPGGNRGNARHFAPSCADEFRLPVFRQSVATFSAPLSLIALSA